MLRMLVLREWRVFWAGQDTLALRRATLPCVFRLKSELERNNKWKTRTPMAQLLTKHLLWVCSWA